MKLESISFLRRLVLPTLKFLNPGTISITHHFTKKKFFLDAFTHKGYWYHGRNREKNTMQIFKDVIPNGSTVFEVGGHIGYISTYFSMLAGANGKVLVFEPGVNNLPYLKKNVENAPFSNIQVIEKAVSNENGTANFFIEKYTGQNNSLVKDYSGRDFVKSMSFVDNEEQTIEVETITLDSFCEKNNIAPDFIKIDIEGAEVMALQGAKNICTTNPPVIMVEISENHEKVFDLLQSYGYVMYNQDKQRLHTVKGHSRNTFCFNPKKHAEFLKQFPS